MSKNILENRLLIQKLVQHLFKNKYLASFSFEAGFILNFEENRKFTEYLGIPIKIVLYPFSEFYFENQNNINSIYDSIIGKDSLRTNSFRAFQIMESIGTNIKDVSIQANSDLILNLDSIKLIIPGIENILEDAWCLDVWSEGSRISNFSVSCDSKGELYCQIPNELIKVLNV